MNSCANIKGLDEHGYAGMPQVEESFASYLVPGVGSLWKAPALSLKQYQVGVCGVGPGWWDFAHHGDVASLPS